MSAKKETPILPMGTETQWGKVAMVGFTGGERYYWMARPDGSVAMIPAITVASDSGKI